VIELELSRPIDARHEGEHQRGVALAQMIGGRAADPLLGQRRLQCIENLVQVHDELVQAVAAPAVGAGDGVDRRALDQVQPGRRQSRQEVVQAGPQIGLSGGSHHLGIGSDGSQHLGAAWHAVVRTFFAAGGGHGVERGCFHGRSRYPGFAR